MFSKNTVRLSYIVFKLFFCFGFGFLKSSWYLLKTAYVFSERGLRGEVLKMERFIWKCKCELLTEASLCYSLVTYATVFSRQQNTSIFFLKKAHFTIYYNVLHIIFTILYFHVFKASCLTCLLWLIFFPYKQFCLTGPAVMYIKHKCWRLTVSPSLSTHQSQSLMPQS